MLAINLERKRKVVLADIHLILNSTRAHTYINSIDWVDASNRKINIVGKYD